MSFKSSILCLSPRVFLFHPPLFSSSQVATPTLHFSSTFYSAFSTKVSRFVHTPLPYSPLRLVSSLFSTASTSAFYAFIPHFRLHPFGKLSTFLPTKKFPVLENFFGGKVTSFSNNLQHFPEINFINFHFFTTASGTPVPPPFSPPSSPLPSKKRTRIAREKRKRIFLILS